MAAAMDFEVKGGYLRGQMEEELRAAKKEYLGNLNFSAYKQARHETYLGTMGKNNYGKSYGNDSSNVQAVLNGPSYWSRVYYRADDEEALPEKEKNAAGMMKKSASEPALPTTAGQKKKKGYALIREKMDEMVQCGNAKPNLPKRTPGERLDFFNSLVKKYNVKSGSDSQPWNIDTLGHRSSPNEVNFISSLYFRKDSDYLLESSTRRR